MECGYALVQGLQQVVGAYVLIARGGNSQPDICGFVRLVEAYIGFASSVSATWKPGAERVGLGADLADGAFASVLRTELATLRSCDGRSQVLDVPLANEDVSICGEATKCVKETKGEFGGGTNGVNDSPGSVNVVHVIPKGQRKGLPRGPNFERNAANRARKRAEKDKKRKGECENAEKEDKKDVNVSRGFWNSCKPETRNLLVESKARMHAAENLRKAKEAEQRCADMDSPFNTMTKAVKMIEFAQKQAQKENDSKVYGWAKTVATSSAESLAKSTPSSVPSFAELEEKLAASSQSSFDLALRAKDEEIAVQKKETNDKICAMNSTIERLEMELVESKLISGQRESFGLKTPSSVCLTPKLEPVGGHARSFVKTKKQPWPHVQLTRADVMEDRYR